MTKKLSDVVAADENGNMFVKHVEVRRMISFGWSVEYDVDNLINNCYPFDEGGLGFCIDAAGPNHKGFSVYIKPEDMNQILGQFVDVKA